jgi:hypothetical protein
VQAILFSAKRQRQTDVDAGFYHAQVRIAYVKIFDVHADVCGAVTFPQVSPPRSALAPEPKGAKRSYSAYALTEAVGQLRALRKQPSKGTLVSIAPPIR